MGLFNKLKNVLFEEEEIEIPVKEEPKKEIKVEPERKTFERKKNVVENDLSEEIPITYVGSYVFIIAHKFI